MRNIVVCIGNGLLSEAKQVRIKTPSCKLVMLCDENSTPDIAFFYSSVTEKYLTAALASL